MHTIKQQCGSRILYALHVVYKLTDETKLAKSSCFLFGVIQLSFFRAVFINTHNQSDFDQLQNGRTENYEDLFRALYNSDR